MSGHCDRSIPALLPRPHPWAIVVQMSRREDEHLYAWHPCAPLPLSRDGGEEFCSPRTGVGGHGKRWAPEGAKSVPLAGRRHRARPPVLPILLLFQDITDQNVPRERRESTRLPWQASAETPCREGESRRSRVRPLTATSPARTHERRGPWARRRLLLRRAARWPQIACFGPACAPMEPVRFHLGHRQRARALMPQDVVELLKRLLAWPAG